MQAQPSMSEGALPAGFFDDHNVDARMQKELKPSLEYAALPLSLIQGFRLLIAVHSSDEWAKFQSTIQQVTQEEAKRKENEEPDLDQALGEEDDESEEKEEDEEFTLELQRKGTGMADGSVWYG